MDLSIRKNVIDNIKNDDYDRCYDIILNDFKNGRIGKISLDRV